MDQASVHQVRVVAYEPGWAAHYLMERGHLSEALGDLFEEVEHIGSTAVPGMWAKPIIDILIGWHPPANVDEVSRRLEPLGYAHVGEDARRPGRIMFHKRSGQWFNLSIVPFGGRLWSDNLAVRDYLRANENAALRYGEVKRTAAQNHSAPQAYQDAKRDFVDQLRQTARRWASQRSDAIRALLAPSSSHAPEHQNPATRPATAATTLVPARHVTCADATSPWSATVQLRRCVHPRSRLKLWLKRPHRTLIDGCLAVGPSMVSKSQRAIDLRSPARRR